MPLTVTAWPYSPDPRDASFSIIGYGFGQVPPFKFLISTTGALPPFDDLNDGILLTLTDENPPLTVYSSLAVAGNQVTKAGFKDPQGVPLHTVEWTLQLARAPGTQYVGDLQQVFPNAIQKFSIPVVAIVGPIGLIPNPVAFLPRSFDFEI